MGPDWIMTVTEDGKDTGGWVSYKFGTKIGLSEPLSRVLEWLDAGANITITYPSGEKKRIGFVEAPNV